jgi:hypothetical protein
LKRAEGIPFPFGPVLTQLGRSDGRKAFFTDLRSPVFSLREVAHNEFNMEQYDMRALGRFSLFSAILFPSFLTILRIIVCAE